MEYVYILKVYESGKWIIWGVYTTRAKAQRVASEWDKDVSISEWTVQ